MLEREKPKIMKNNKKSSPGTQFEQTKKETVQIPSYGLFDNFKTESNLSDRTDEDMEDNLLSELEEELEEGSKDKESDGAIKIPPPIAPRKIRGPKFSVEHERMMQKAKEYIEWYISAYGFLPSIHKLIMAMEDEEAEFPQVKIYKPERRKMQSGQREKRKSVPEDGEAQERHEAPQEQYTGLQNARIIKKINLERTGLDHSITPRLNYNRNEIIAGTTVFNLAGKSGVLLKKINDGAYKVIDLEKRNVRVVIDFDVGTLVDRVETIGISSCSFIALTDNELSFAVVCHLDAEDQIYNVLAEMENLNLHPTRMVASIVTSDPPPFGEEEGHPPAPAFDTNELQTSQQIEVVRVRNIAQKYRIADIEILDRGNSTHARENSHNLIGVDLRDFSIFGSMGDDKDFEKQFTGLLNEIAETGNLKRALSRFGLEYMEEDVYGMFIREIMNKKMKAGTLKDIIKAGATICLKDKNKYRELFEMLYDKIKAIEFHHPSER